MRTGIEQNLRMDLRILISDPPKFIQAGVIVLTGELNYVVVSDQKSC